MNATETYHAQLEQIMKHGEDTPDRTGTGVRSLFGMQARYDLREGFPLITSKRVFTRGVVGELLWFLEGSTNRNRLEEITFGTVGERATIWDEWAQEDRKLGPIYGRQWRKWGGIAGADQIDDLIFWIKRDPHSRRHIVSAWNVAEVDDMALPPCHTLWQVNVQGEYMDLQLYQRSADMFLGVPFNIASYALLLEMIAAQTGYTPRHFVHAIGNAHIYQNHFGQVEEQLSRTIPPAPQLILAERPSIFEYRMEDFVFEGYAPHPAIKAEVAV